VHGVLFFNSAPSEVLLEDGCDFYWFFFFQNVYSLVMWLIVQWMVL
jgi:hypothetical protein